MSEGEQLSEGRPRVNVRQMYVPVDQFERGVELLRRFREAGSVRLFVGPTSVHPSLLFMVEENDPDLRRALQDASLTLRDLWDVTFDVVDVLSAATSGVTSERFAEVRANPERWEDGEIEDPELATRKHEIVATNFDIDDLQRRIWVKETSKNDLAVHCTWEVASKISDEQATRLDNEQSPVPYAIVKIRAEPPTGPGFRIARLPQELVMTMDREDVRYFINSLTQLQSAMQRAEGGSGVEREDPRNASNRIEAEGTLERAEAGRSDDG